MKKFLALSLALMLMFSLAACGNSQTPAPAASAAPAGEPAPAATEAPAGEPAGEEPAGEAPSGDPILIGVFGPLSGDSAMVGQTEIEGVQLAVDQINAAGGVHGRPIEIKPEDDAQNPATAVSAVNKLIYSDDVLALIGTINSSCTLAAMEVSMDAGVPHITPISSGASITNVGNPWIARIQASDLLQAGAAVDYCVEKLGATKIGCIYQSDDYGTGAWEVIKEQLQTKYGMELAASEAFEASAADVSAQVLNLKAAECDAIIIWTMYQQGALIAKTVRQQGMDAPLVGGGGLTNAKLYELGGDAVVGIVNSQTFFANNPNASDAQKNFVDSFQAKYGKVPDSNNAMAYDAMMVMAEGLKYAGPELDRAKIMEGILAVKDMELATGKITMAENGDAVREEILMVRLVGDQQYELVTD